MTISDNANIDRAAYQNLYIVEPGTSMVVEAMPDPVGLKMGVIVGINSESQELIYQRFQCKNEAIFNISEISGEDISFYGGTIAIFVTSFSGHGNIIVFSRSIFAIIFITNKLTLH